ncbi:MAG TPA: hypothetical protein V6D33_19070 [Cyanophyceae cyanobacterium]
MQHDFSVRLVPNQYQLGRSNWIEALIRCMNWMPLTEFPIHFYIIFANKSLSTSGSTLAITCKLAQGTGEKSALIPLEIALFCPTAQATTGLPPSSCNAFFANYNPRSPD